MADEILLIEGGKIGAEKVVTLTEQTLMVDLLASDDKRRSFVFDFSVMVT